MRPLTLLSDSLISATSKAARSSSPCACSFLTESKTDLASMTAIMAGSWNVGFSEAITDASPCNPPSSSISKRCRGLYRENLSDSSIATCFSMDPSAVDMLMASHRFVDPAFRRSFRDLQVIRDTGAFLPRLSWSVVVACSHPCCGFDLPLGSKELSAISKCRKSSSGKLWILSWMWWPLILATTRPWHRRPKASENIQPKCWLLLRRQGVPHEQPS